MPLASAFVSQSPASSSRETTIAAAAAIMSMLPSAAPALSTRSAWSSSRERLHATTGIPNACARVTTSRPIAPPPITGRETAADLIENAFLAYNAGRLREGARLLAERMLRPGVTVGLSLTGALTPAGLGVSCLVPLLRAGVVDWVVSTGANLYHDAHFGLGLPMHAGSPFLDDRVLLDAAPVFVDPALIARYAPMQQVTPHLD